MAAIMASSNWALLRQVTLWILGVNEDALFAAPSRQREPF